MKPTPDSASSSQPDRLIRAAPPTVVHATDTREIRDRYRARLLLLLHRTGWARRHEVALSIAPTLPISTATRRAQRALAAAVADGLVQRRDLPNGGCLYAVTAIGARWLREHLNVEAHAMTRALAQATRLEHRSVSTQIGLAGELLGARALFERETYQAAAQFSGAFKKVPDAMLLWEEGPVRLASWHEVDLSPRGRKDLPLLQAGIRLLDFSHGVLDGSGRQLCAFVFHAKTGAPLNQLRRELAKMASEAAWEGDLTQGWLRANGYFILVEALPSILNWWPEDHASGGLTLPWAGPGSVVELPNEQSWLEGYQAGGPSSAFRGPSPMQGLR